MEQLQEMLIAYNTTIPESKRHSWSEQYLSSPFPLYWQVVFSELALLDRSMRILEIGAGQGDITAISCYLGFKNITAYERTPEDFSIAQKKLTSLFDRDDILKNASYNNKLTLSDVLILVNCAYADGCSNKEQYISTLKGYYETAKSPRLFLLEVIDPSYSVTDNDFPIWIRLSEKDIFRMFPQAEIRIVETYRYPQNKRSKKLYIIKPIS